MLETDDWKCVLKVMTLRDKLLNFKIVFRLFDRWEKNNSKHSNGEKERGRESE